MSSKKRKSDALEDPEESEDEEELTDSVDDGEALDLPDDGILRTCDCCDLFCASWAEKMLFPGSTLMELHGIWKDGGGEQNDIAAIGPVKHTPALPNSGSHCCAASTPESPK